MQHATTLWGAIMELAPLSKVSKYEKTNWGQGEFDACNQDGQGENHCNQVHADQLEERGFEENEDKIATWHTY